jgi:hypothetical protein
VRTSLIVVPDPQKPPFHALRVEVGLCDILLAPPTRTASYRVLRPELSMLRNCSPRVVSTSPTRAFAVGCSNSDRRFLGLCGGAVLDRVIASISTKWSSACICGARSIMRATHRLEGDRRAGILRYRPQTNRRQYVAVQFRLGNLRELLLGHAKIESAVRYLDIEVDDALAIAEQVDV